MHPSINQIKSAIILLLIALPLPIEQTDTVLNRVDGIANDGQNDKEADYDDGDDDVAFYHFFFCFF